MHKFELRSTICRPFRKVTADIWQELLEYKYVSPVMSQSLWDRTQTAMRLHGTLQHSISHGQRETTICQVWSAHCSSLQSHKYTRGKRKTSPIIYCATCALQQSNHSYGQPKQSNHSFVSEHIESTTSVSYHNTDDKCNVSIYDKCNLSAYNNCKLSAYDQYNLLCALALCRLSRQH